MMLKELETASANTTVETNDILDSLKYNEAGLIAAIAQQHDTGEVLMMAWMNRQSIEETLQTGQVCYWSRSRNSYWRKGETSGNQQTLVKMYADCDGDTLLLKVEQKGAACHTLRRDCFYIEVGKEKSHIISDHGE